MPGLLEEVKKHVNRPVPELARSEDTDIIEDVKSAKKANGSVSHAEAATRTVNSISDSVAGFVKDAPTCPNCGHIAVRNGACFKCLNCGESLGCS